MMIDELALMLDKFKEDTGKVPTKIICGEKAFEKLRREAIDDWGADRYLEPNINRDGYVARFAGIPIQVVYDNNVLKDDKIYVFNELTEDCYSPVRYIYSEGFERYCYGQWNTVVQNEENLADISENVWMSVLNGGGFNAVQGN